MSDSTQSWCSPAFHSHNTKLLSAPVLSGEWRSASCFGTWSVACQAASCLTCETACSGASTQAAKGDILASGLPQALSPAAAHLVRSQPDHQGCLQWAQRPGPGLTRTWTSPRRRLDSCPLAQAQMPFQQQIEACLAV